MKASSKLLIAASLLAASTVASASIVTFTFNASGLTTSVANGNNGAANPNISSISAGYYDGTTAVAGGSVGYYNSNGFGVYSPDPSCGSLPSNTSTVQYQCVVNGDDHFVDNNDNTADKQKRVKSNGNWGSWQSLSTFTNSYDDFATFKFTNDVRVTSVTLGLWDWNSENTGTEQYCHRYWPNNTCREWRTRNVYDYSIDLSFNTSDAVAGPWSALHIDLGSSAPSQGDSLVVNLFGLYPINNYFSLGAGFGLSNTGFKIKSLTVDDSPPEQFDCSAAPTLPECSTTVPEPGTLSSLGLAALAMAAVGRLRRRRTS